MFPTLVTCTLLLTLVLTGVQADLNIVTLELTQCKDAHVTWDPTTPPYNLIVVPEDNPCDAVVKDLGDHYGTSMKWNVNIPKYSKVMFSLVDAHGVEGWSGVMTVNDSDDASCLSAADLGKPTPKPTSSKPTSSQPSSSQPSSSKPSSSTPPPSKPTSPTNTTNQDGTSVPSTTGTVVPIGAVNPGIAHSGAPPARQLNGVTIAMIALTAIAAFTL